MTAARRPCACGTPIPANPATVRDGGFVRCRSCGRLWARAWLRGGSLGWEAVTAEEVRHRRLLEVPTRAP